MPAAAVIPTLKVHVKVVAVKTLVVGFKERFSRALEHVIFLGVNLNLWRMVSSGGVLFCYFE